MICDPHPCRFSARRRHDSQRCESGARVRATISCARPVPASRVRFLGPVASRSFEACAFSSSAPVGDRFQGDRRADRFVWSYIRGKGVCRETACVMQQTRLHTGSVDQPHTGSMDRLTRETEDVGGTLEPRAKGRFFNVTPSPHRYAKSCLKGEAMFDENDSTMSHVVSVSNP